MKKIIIPIVVALLFTYSDVTAQTVVVRRPVRKTVVIKPCPKVIAVAPQRAVVVHRAPVVVATRPVVRPRKVVVLR
ncbi:MAG: hypothetical protein WC756_14855 [Taibaiella sp.]|jgi:hypothetical protein